MKSLQDFKKRSDEGYTTFFSYDGINWGVFDRHLIHLNFNTTDFLRFWVTTRGWWG